MSNNIVEEDSFSLRKIDILVKNEFENTQKLSLDKVKILNFSNSIDKWEREILFSDNGFYSLKGKDVEDKTKEFYLELKKFVNMKISELKLNDFITSDIISDIKEKKLKTILEQMQNYEKEQISIWETQVFEEGLKSVIDRAILYKNSEKIILSSLNNGLSILKMMAEKENWNTKTLNSKVDLFESEFFTNLINSYIESKDLKAIVLFEKYKDKLLIEDIDNFEKSLYQFKNKIIAYNWAKELFSYNLSEDENKREINAIKDEEIKVLVLRLLKEFQEQKQKIEKKKEQEKNEKNWQEIISVLEKEKDKAFLYVDITLDKKHQKSKENYIKKIIKDEKIKTDEKKFVDILDEFLNDYDVFVDKDLSDYREFFSKEDFDYVVKLQQMNLDDYVLASSDYKFLKDKLYFNGIKAEKDIYLFVQLFWAMQKEYSSTNKKEIDTEAKNKLIDLALSRLKKQKREE